MFSFCDISVFFTACFCDYCSYFLFCVFGSRFSDYRDDRTCESFGFLRTKLSKTIEVWPADGFTADVFSFLIGEDIIGVTRLVKEDIMFLNGLVSSDGIKGAFWLLLFYYV